MERRQLIEPLISAVQTAAGVVGVHDQLSYRHDDPVMPAPAPRPYY